MIKNVMSGLGIDITNSYTNWPSFYNTVTSTGNSLVGQVRYNGSSQNLEVYDGNSWIIITGSYPQISLSTETQMILNWAKTKMAEEAELQKLAQENVTVQDALTAVEHANEQLRIAAALVKV